MSIAVPLGFRFAGVHAGIKKYPGKEDLTLVHCPGGAVAAGVYTTNLVHAAPVVVDLCTGTGAFPSGTSVSRSPIASSSATASTSPSATGTSRMWPFSATN